MQNRKPPAFVMVSGGSNGSAVLVLLVAPASLLQPAATTGDRTIHPGLHATNGAGGEKSKR
jgi:hypothetical protein